MCRVDEENKCVVFVRKGETLYIVLQWMNTHKLILNKRSWTFVPKLVRLLYFTVRFCAVVVSSCQDHCSCCLSSMCSEKGGRWVQFCVGFLYIWLILPKELAANWTVKTAKCVTVAFVYCCLFVCLRIFELKQTFAIFSSKNEWNFARYLSIFFFSFFFPWAKNQNLLASISPSHCPFRLSWRIRLDANEWCCKSSVGLGTEMYIVFVAWWKLWNGFLTKKRSFLPSKK